MARKPYLQRNWRVVYGLIDPRDDNVRYVGCTKNLINRRSVHIHHAKLGRRSHRLDWMRELLAADLRPKETWLGEAEGNLAYALEAYWIAELRRHGARLTNENDGGTGTPGMRHSPEAKERIGAYWRDRKRPAETRRRMSEAQRGKRGGHRGS